MKKTNKFIAQILIIAMTFTIIPAKSEAKYKDKSDELPGMTDDSTIIALGAVAAVGVGVLVYFLIKKKKQNKAMSVIEYRKNIQPFSWENQLSPTINGEENSFALIQKNETSSFPIQPKNNLMQQIENAKNTVPVDLIITPLSNNNNFNLNSNGVQVGLRIRF